MKCFLSLDINYLWNFEVAEDVKWDPFPLRILELKGSEFQVKDMLKLSIKGPKLTPISYLNLPICKNGNSPGRWVKSFMIEDKNQKSSSSDWSAPRDSTTHFKDPEGRVWVPYDCRYIPFSYSDFTTCLAKANTHLHIYGDSNIRRALKAITTAGAWCNTLYDPDSWECQCSDQGRVAVPYFNDLNQVNYFEKVAGAPGFSIFYEKVTGFPSQQGPFDQILNESHIIQSFAEAGGRTYQAPAAVIFNLGRRNN